MTEEKEGMSKSQRARIEEAAAYSSMRLKQLQETLCTSNAGKQLHSMGVSLVVSGSLGRLESSLASDIDLVTLCPNTTSLDQVRPLDQEVRHFLRSALNVEVSSGENFTGPTFLNEVRASAQIGGSGDNVNWLTKRATILTETRAVLNPEFARDFRESILQAYLQAPEVKRRYLIPIADEIVRYYRTLCIDYKSRIDHERKPWAVRYLKLRNARKYWFFSLMLGMTSILAQSEPDDEGAEAQLMDLFDTTPTERIRSALHLAGLTPHQAIFAYYGRFLSDMESKVTRSCLEGLKYEDRLSSPVYVRLKQNTDRLHRSMLEIVESLPSAWRRHLLSRFLLHS